MKLSISNIGWQPEDDRHVYDLMMKYGYSGLEIAPTRIFPEAPYDCLAQASSWAGQLRKTYGFAVPSMQSIWFGRQEKLFGTPEEKQLLIDYTKKAVDFAEAIGCRNLVFGCPRNRNLPDGADESTALPFFKELGDYAAEHHTVIGMEANPPIYHTNYINDIASALELVERVDSEGFRLNLDVGTMIQNGEDVDVIAGKVKLISHVHISEPGLKPIVKRKMHQDLREVLQEERYRNYISIEMGRGDGADAVQKIEAALRYIKEVFGFNGK